MKLYGKHIITICILIIYLLMIAIFTGTIQIGFNQLDTFDPWKKYGTLGATFLFFVRLLPILSIPLTVFNFLGIIYFNTHPKKPVLKASLLFGPFLCFRVVTRGMFPSLVKRNIERNIEKCQHLGLTNFVFEIATDKSIGVKNSGNVREIVVPEKYQTKNGALYKARALQYCLEDNVNILSDNDWIIHLDEETLITENSLIGIINFINDGSYEFGQGVITYGSEHVVNWLTTFADSIRVGMDYGIIRFTLGVLHRPVFSWKGSYVVSNVKAERHISYDFGEEGSIAEDCFFALLAWKEGYKFGWIDGDMWEKSTFSISDFIKQRKRWVQGICNALYSSKIPVQYKCGIFQTVLSWCFMPLSVLNIVFIPLFPFQLSPFFNIPLSFMGGFMMFLFTFGAVKSFAARRQSYLPVLLAVVMVVMLPVCTILETVSIIWAFCSRERGGFHVVKKDIEESPILSHV